jgi:hypothetical protein
MRTFDDSHIDAIKIWIKELRAPSGAVGELEEKSLLAH